MKEHSRVHLFVRNVNDISESISETKFGHAATSGLSAIFGNSVKHWAIIIEWIDSNGKVKNKMVYEAFNRYGNLVAEKGTLDIQEWEARHGFQKIDLGKFENIDQDHCETFITRFNKKSIKYKATSDNCQRFCKEMCQYLGLKTKFPLCINEITNVNCFVVKSSNSCSTDPSVTINDLYEIPTKKETKPSIYKVMNYIKEQEIKVSSLNIEYTGSTYIKDKVLREQLKKQFGDGVFQAYTKNEDKKLKQRWEELRNAKVDFDNFKKNLFDFCEGGRQRNKKKIRRQSFVRNIIGLYVGQDLPHKLAYSNFNRIKKIFYKSPSLKRKCNKWTLTDDQNLLNFVINSQTSQVDIVSKISDKEVNWVACKKELFPERSSKAIREHWQRKKKNMKDESLQSMMESYSNDKIIIKINIKY